MTRCCVILNPQAGHGRAGQARSTLLPMLQQALEHVDLVTTRARGDATQAAVQAIAQGCTQLIAVGGDGTLNEVVNGIMRSRALGLGDATLGIIPIGSGSDFIKSLDGDWSDNLPVAVERVVRGHTRTVDLGLVVAEGQQRQTARYLLNAAGLAVGPHIARIQASKRQLTGNMAYLLAALQAAMHYRPQPLTIRFAGRVLPQPWLIATVANGRCQGGNFWLTPWAQIDDGLLDLCLIQAMSVPAMLWYMRYLRNPSGRHTRLRQVTTDRARRISITYQRPDLLALDGEIILTDTMYVMIETLTRTVKLIF
ncbi:MAG: YegS/Rv2252/BmrU family lipid kinase [Chloroflexaceae bacterium]|nr:YegS/Rv2252/BmrU family lipid kinase [Chloroflexaceae bacterium]